MARKPKNPHTAAAVEALAEVGKDDDTQVSMSLNGGPYSKPVGGKSLRKLAKRLKDEPERLVEMGDGGFAQVRQTYRLALHHHETQKRRMKTAKNRVVQTEGDLRNAAENVPFNPMVMGELAEELAKRIIVREGTERDLKRTRANLKAATECYVAFEEEDPERGQ